VKKKISILDTPGRYDKTLPLIKEALGAACIWGAKTDNLTCGQISEIWDYMERWIMVEEAHPA